MEAQPAYLTAGLARWRARTDGLLLVLAIGTLPFLLVEIKREELPTADRLLVDTVNVIVLIAFAADYIVELVLASDRRAYARHEWTSLLIVVTQAIAILRISGRSLPCARYEGSAAFAQPPRSLASWRSEEQRRRRVAHTSDATPAASRSARLD